MGKQYESEAASVEGRRGAGGTMSNIPLMDPEVLVRLANARMPFGKYSGRLLIDLPESYLIWFARKGYPEGELGKLLASVYEIKENGLEYLLRPLVRRG
jgi:uncharacterized protein (DUF3820 family)